MLERFHAAIAIRTWPMIGGMRRWRAAPSLRFRAPIHVALSGSERVLAWTTAAVIR